MKNIIWIVLVHCFTLTCFSQSALDTDGLNNNHNVYLYSLKEYCKTLDSTKVKTVYVQKEHFIGENWPTKIAAYEIKYLYDRREYKKAIKDNEGGVTVVGIGHLNFRNGRFSVSVTPFGATYKKGIINLSNGGGWAMYFNYDPEQGGLIYVDKKLYGI